MAQSATTVTACNPSPPTNMSTIGWTAPDPSFFANSVYTTSIIMPGQGGTAIPELHYPYGAPGTYATTAPWFDDGFSNNPLSLTWNETGGVDPNFGAGAKAAPVNGLLFVATHATVTDSSGPPAITALTPESLGLEVNANVSWTGIQGVTGAAGGYIHVTRIAAAGTPMTQAIRDNGPNASHGSSLSVVPALTPTTTGATGVNNVGNGTATTLTVTGTNYNRSSVVYIDGVAQPTNYVSATSLTVTNAIKRSSTGNMAITVKNTNSGITSGSFNWVLS
jgi:hypothetical protein